MVYFFSPRTNQLELSNFQSVFVRLQRSFDDIASQRKITKNLGSIAVLYVLEIYCNLLLIFSVTGMKSLPQEQVRSRMTGQVQGEHGVSPN